jgi:hypothetical protein
MALTDLIYQPRGNGMSVPQATNATKGGGNMFDPISMAVMAGLGGYQETTRANNEAENAAAQQNLSNSQRRAAQGALKGYGYQMYDSPYKSFYDQHINTWLNGGLSDAQQGALNAANQQGLSNINTVMANRGGTVGGQLAMTQKHNADIAQQRANTVDSNINQGFNLAQMFDNMQANQWANQQNADMRYKELMAQYAPGEDVKAEKSKNIFNLFGLL